MDNENLNDIESNSEELEHDNLKVIPLSGMYENWFVEYASYVILERAVPALEDGLKPVQRRILHSLWELEDGRYNKVANVIGNTMKYHPHGDAAIGDAIINLGQKELLIDTQGNWGDISTGDSAAAPRYIEARLSKFALQIVFNPKTTLWQRSYDGRNREPVFLPVKFPLVLAQGVEGIAVGLSTKILPHNFIEIIEASISILNGKKTNILPDFPTGGYADFTNYNEGKRGGRIRIRAKIEEKDKKTLLIKEIPFGTTTGNLIESIIKANDKNKIKIKKVTDNTARELEIEIQLAQGVSTDKTIDALYAFTDCELSISPNSCIIFEDKPYFWGVNEILEKCTFNTVEILKKELEINRDELEEKWHFGSLEKIFIENRIYHQIEECETWEEIINTIDLGLEPFKKLLKREITKDDIEKLTEIKIKRISKFDSFKADEYLKNIEIELDEVNAHLANLVKYAIRFFEALLKQFGKGRERKTEIRKFDSIEANVVAVANQKLYANFAEGFVGFGLKKDNYICDCSDLDDVIAIRDDGKYKVCKISEKAFFGKNLIHVDVFRKNDDRKVYNAIYFDSNTRKYFSKRFSITGVTRDKEYDITQGKQGSKIIYLSANPNGEAEIVTIQLSNMSKARNKIFDFNFAELSIKNRNSIGNTLTKFQIRKVVLKEKGRSTIGGRSIYFEPSIGRLNADGRGDFLGNFDNEDKILVIYNEGSYEMTDFELTNHYETKDIMLICKYNPKIVLTVLYYIAAEKQHYVKRFNIETSTIGKKFMFIQEGKGNYLAYVSDKPEPILLLKTVNKKGEKEEKNVNLSEFIAVKGWKSLGNKLTNDTLKSFEDITPQVIENDETIEPVDEIPFTIEMGNGDETDENKDVNSKDDAKPDNPVQFNLF
ncbi:MAG: DNA gyrase/topoisomerase IV subunit A [Bacteroidetes bacterium]|nr:DNA gyrase/topoisomerase IV subunit A [Bacteroidota bacterium]